MKKISILLFAIMIVGSLCAQIESFSESDIIMSTPSKPTFDKFNYLQPFTGNLSPFGSNVTNIIGEQLFCKTSGQINSTQNYYVVAKSKEGLFLSQIEQGKYFTVKDILISKEEIDSLKSLFKALSFKSDTLYYNDVNNTVAVILDKSQPLPKKVKQFMIPKEDVFTILYHKYRNWPNMGEFVKGQEIQTAIYVLTDEKGCEYYIPLKDKRYENAYKFELHKSSILFFPGSLADISCFVTVSGFKNIKKNFEGQRIIRQSFEKGKNKDDIKICKKIAFKDGQIMAAVSDTMSTTISYFPITGLKKRALSWFQQNDSLLFIKIKAGTSKYMDANGNYVYATMEYCTIHDLDSVEAKIAYEKRMEEQEKLRKDERKKQELIKKYGVKIGESIVEGKACVGMNSEQCMEAMGIPDNISKKTSNLGVIEIWTYSREYRIYNGLVPITVVTFLDEKVTSVDEYSSWPY